MRPKTKTKPTVIISAVIPADLSQAFKAKIGGITTVSDAVKQLITKYLGEN